MRAIAVSKMMRGLIGLTLLAGLLLINIKQPALIKDVFLKLSVDEDITDSINQIFINRNYAIISGDLKLIQSMYDTSTKYGIWAYEHESTKAKYIHNWEQKQGAKFIDIIPAVKVRSIKQNGEKYTINLMCSTEYKYIYENEPDVINSFMIGTYHVLDMKFKDNAWVITREWYKDPFEDSLNLDKIDVDSIKQYISTHAKRDISSISERRKNVVEYADKYSGAANMKNCSPKYNKKYRNYNSQGGDCANFASQMLYEGGKFRKTHAWNYDDKGATRAWVNADGFKNYMLYSGRASLIAYGNYEKVYKASYKLLPGDFIAYEKNGDITHISVVTGVDSKGYSLVNCHNTDRNRVPWDLGWSGSKIKFWLVRVHF